MSEWSSLFLWLGLSGGMWYSGFLVGKHRERLYRLDAIKGMTEVIWQLTDYAELGVVLFHTSNRFEHMQKLLRASCEKYAIDYPFYTEADMKSEAPHAQ